MKSLRHRFSLVPLLALATTLFSLLVFVAVGATELMRERARLLQAARQATDTAIALSTPPVAQALWNFDTEGLQDLSRSLVREGIIAAVEVRADDSDRPVRAVRAGWSGKGETALREIDLFVPSRPQRIGVLTVTESLDEVNQHVVDQALSRLPAELLKVLAISLGLLLLLHRLVTRRLKAVVAGLAALRMDDPQARLPLPPFGPESRDEIVVLADAVNRFHAARANEVLRRREAEGHLREQLNERSVTLGSLSDGLLTLDGAMRVRFANGSAAALLCRPVDELIGHTLDGLAAVTVPGDDAPLDLATWLEAVAACPGQRSATVRMLPVSGPAFDAQAVVNALAEGGEVALVVVLYDVSESVGREQAERARERAEAANLAKSEFLSRMSHELRTPLNAIIGFGQSLELDSLIRADPQRLRQVQLIGRAGWHLTRMIGDVLELSRIEAGSLKLELHAVDVRPLLDVALAYLGADAKADGVTIDTQIDATACYVVADVVRLEQVLVNLISNAIKYNRPGGRVQVRVTAIDAHTAALRVQDTGIGMDTEQVSQLYQSFNRLGRETSAKPGTGIGLVVTRALVEAMHGSLALESRPGVGSTFTVCLPLASVERQALAKPTHAVARSAAPDHGMRRVVYVEDDAVNAEVMRALLSLRPGLHLQVCDTLAAGWAAINLELPDLLLLDMHVPDGSGIDLLLRIQSEPRLAGVPVLMVSADALDASVATALAAGALAYITKPLNFDDTLRQVDAILAAAHPVSKVERR